MLEGYVDYRKISEPLKVDLVEIGFGNAQFLLALAEQNPDKSVLGIEISDISIRKLIRRLKKDNIKNLLFTKIDAFWGFQILLEDNSVSRIYINYPCPWFKKRHHRRRITRREALITFAKKLKGGGQIIIRTDHYDFVDYTIQQAQDIFEVKSSEINVREPTTKYERKWLEQKRKIYEITLTKIESEKEQLDETRSIRVIKDTSEHMLIPKRKTADEIFNYFLNIREKEIRVGERIVAKFFDAYRSEGKMVVEGLISEDGFVQTFFLSIKELKDGYLIDVSKFSEVLRTKGVLKLVRYVSDVLSKEEKL